MRSLLGFAAGCLLLGFPLQDLGQPNPTSDVSPDVEQQLLDAYALPLKREIAYLNDMFELTEQQNSRLELAVRGAVRRYQASLRKPRMMLTDSSGFRVYVRGDVRALGFDVTNAFVPFEPLWVKAVSSTLTPDQFKAFQDAHSARLKYRRRGRVGAIVARIDSRLRLSVQQREQVEALVESEFGDEIEKTWGDHRVLSWFEFQLLNFEPDRLKKILSERQMDDVAVAMQLGWWRGDEGGNPMAGGGFGGGGMGGGGLGGGLGGGGLGFNQGWGGVPGGGGGFF